jgi:hypothetical protein
MYSTGTAFGICAGLFKYGVFILYTEIPKTNTGTKIEKIAMLKYSGYKRYRYARLLQYRYTRYRYRLKSLE